MQIVKFFQNKLKLKRIGETLVTFLIYLIMMATVLIGMLLMMTGAALYWTSSFLCMTLTRWIKKLCSLLKLKEKKK